MATSLASLVRTALRKIDAGRTWDLTLHERLALAQAERDLGTRRSLSSYAPRTRRRYLSALDKGISAAEQNRADRVAQNRRDRNRLQRIEELRLAIVATGLDSRYHLRDDMRDYIDMYGEAQIEQRLRDQLESIRRYQSGDSKHGNERIMAYRQGRGRLVVREDVMGDMGFIDPLYWYHAKK